MEQETFYCLDILQLLAHAKQANASTASDAVFC